MSYSSLSFSSVVHSISPSLSSLLLSLLRFSFLPSHGFFSEGALPAAQAGFGTEPNAFWCFLSSKVATGGNRVVVNSFCR